MSLETGRDRAYPAGMKAIRAILMLLGALSVLMLGAVPASAGEAPTPPCHETMAEGPDLGMDAPSDLDPASKPPFKAMACCVACVAAPAPTTPTAQALVGMRPAPTARLQTLPVGQGPSPEHGPPRLPTA